MLILALVIVYYCIVFLFDMPFRHFVFSPDFEERGRVHPVLIVEGLINKLVILVVVAWKVDMLAQSLWYVDIMTDVSLRPESWFEWQTRLCWYSALQDGEREEWREVARAIIDLLQSCRHGKHFCILCYEPACILCDCYIWFYCILHVSVLLFMYLHMCVCIRVYIPGIVC